MKLSMSMIESRLGAYDIESAIRDDARTIRGMRFISEQQAEFSRDYIYIGQAADYLRDPGYSQAFILASGRNSIVCWSSDYETLLNDVLGSFEFFNEAEQGLLVAASRHAPLHEMMPIVEDMLADPFVVFGVDGSVLASVNPERIESPRMRKNVIVRGNLGADGIGGYFTDETGTIHRDLSATPLSMRDEEGFSAVSMYLYQDNEPIGFIMHLPNKGRNGVLAQAIDPVLAMYLSQAEEFTNALSPHQSQRLALADLMVGGYVSPEALERLASAVGAATRLVVISAASLVIQNRTQRMLLANEVEESRVLCVACEVDEAVAFLVADANTEALVAQIAQLFSKKSLALGVSMPVAGFDRVQSAYRQAVSARDSSRSAGIRYCRDLALPFLIEALQKEPVARDLLHPALGTLEKYDGENGTDLLETLRAFVECGCSQSETAQKLYVHLNKHRQPSVFPQEGIWMLKITNLHKTFNPGTVNAKTALAGVDLHLKDGDFVTVIGGNGAGKSTILNAIAGVWKPDYGTIQIDGVDVTNMPEHKRAAFLGRVFQDPMKGTAPDMEIAENLAIAARRGTKRRLIPGVRKAEREEYKKLLATLELGLEDRLSAKVGLLSGGQRQAVTLLMASLRRPKLLLLDEHTAALDPKTAAKVLEITDKIVTENKLTTLMITHNMRDAITHGNRLIMMHEGHIVVDVQGEEKQKLTVEDLLSLFAKASGHEFSSDRAILS